MVDPLFKPPLLKPPPLRVVSRGANVSLLIQLLNRIYLALYTRYRKGGLITKGTVGKLLLAIAATVLLVALALSRWSKADRHTTAGFYAELVRSNYVHTGTMLSFAQEFTEQWGDLMRPRTGHIPGLGRAIGAVENAIENVVLPRIAGVNSEVDRVRSYLVGAGQSIPAGAFAQIPRLHERVTDLRTETLGYVRSLDASIVAVAGRVTDLRTETLGYVRTLDQHIVDLRTELRVGVARLTAEMEPLRDYVLPLAAAIPLAVMIPAVQTLIANRPKLETQCRWDADDFEQIMDVLLLLFGWATLIEVLRLTADSADELVGDVLRPILP